MVLEVRNTIQAIVTYLIPSLYLGDLERRSSPPPTQPLYMILEEVHWRRWRTMNRTWWGFRGRTCIRKQGKKKHWLERKNPNIQYFVLQISNSFRIKNSEWAEPSSKAIICHIRFDIKPDADPAQLDGIINYLFKPAITGTHAATPSIRPPIFKIITVK